jgi:hypothetical protein
LNERRANLRANFFRRPPVAVRLDLLLEDRALSVIGVHDLARWEHHQGAVFEQADHGFEETGMVLERGTRIGLRHDLCEHLFEIVECTELADEPVMEPYILGYQAAFLILAACAERLHDQTSYSGRTNTGRHRRCLVNSPSVCPTRSTPGQPMVGDPTVIPAAWRATNGDATQAPMVGTCSQ